MEIGVPTSFIPHDATTTSDPHRYDSGGGLNDLFALVSVVLFVASGALAAGSFLYLQYVTSQSTSKVNQIQSAQAAFDPSLIQQLTRLDSRMNSAETLLSGHIAPTALFAALDATTLSTVSFSDLDFKATDPQGITLHMSGVARDINSVALQADIFSKSGVITSPIFSGIDQQTDGVHFTVTALVNPAALNYETLVSGEQASGVNSVPLNASSSNTSTAAPSPFGGSAPTTQPSSGATQPTQ